MPAQKAASSRKSTAAQSRPVDGDFDMDDEAYGDLRVKERELKNSMVVDVSLRKGERQRRLEVAFDDQVRDLEGQIEERAETYEQETKRIQDEIVTRLLALTQKKADVEKQIVQHVQELAEAYDIVKGEFQAVLKGRSQDVHDAINALCGLQEDNDASPEDDRN